MFTFNARNYQPMVSLDPVPEGWYKVIVRKSNNKPVREKPQEWFLELQLEIIEGQFTGRTLYWNLNIGNSSQQAVEIAYRQMSAICHVIGQFGDINGQNVQDNVAPQLHNVPFFVHAVITQGQRGPMNNLRGVKDIYGNEPGKTGGAVAQQPATAPGGWGASAAPAPAPGWAGGNAGGTAPGGYAPPAYQAPPPPQQAAPPPAYPPAYAPPTNPPPQQAAPPPPQQPPAGGWTTGGQPTQPAQQTPPPPPQQPGPPAPQPQQWQPPGPGPGGPAGAAPWGR